MIKKLIIVTFAVYVSTIQSVHAKARRPATPAIVPHETAVPGNQSVQQQPAPDPIFQCQYCKRSFHGSEGKMMRFHAHDKDNWMCIDCFYDSIDFAQKYKARVEAVDAARAAKKLKK